VTARFKDLCLDAGDHQALADWWCTAFGYRRKDELEPPTEDDGSPWARPLDWPVPIVDPTGAGPLIWVIAVPEPKTVKNRIHPDFFGVTAELLELGATVVRLAADAEDPDVEWDVLADPQGNEFCVFAPPAESAD
jgi:Glyoxalase-like domain